MRWVLAACVMAAVSRLYIITPCGAADKRRMERDVSKRIMERPLTRCIKPSTSSSISSVLCAASSSALSSLSLAVRSALEMFLRCSLSICMRILADI